MAALWTSTGFSISTLFSLSNVLARNTSLKNKCRKYSLCGLLKHLNTYITELVLSAINYVLSCVLPTELGHYGVVKGTHLHVCNDASTTHQKATKNLIMLQTLIYFSLDWYFVHVIKEFEGELRGGIGLHAWNMRSHFGLIIHWLYNYCCICIYMYHMCACILKAWQLTREYLHLTFNLEWLQVSSDSKSCWLRLTLSPFCGHKMDWEYCGLGWGATSCPQDGLTYNPFTLNHGLLDGGRYTWCTASP